VDIPKNSYFDYRDVHARIMNI